MRIPRLVYLVSAVLLLAAASASAQDIGKTGLVMGFPGDIGLIWQASDKVAIRPAVSFSGSSSDETAASTTNWSVSGDVSVLFYVKKYDSVRTYVAPRFIFGRASSTFDAATLPVIQGTPIEPSFTSHVTHTGGGAMFGAQYDAHRHFGVYGEVGFVFTHLKTSLSLGSPESGANSWGTSAGVGVILHL
jgi:hypothetical protein